MATQQRHPGDIVAHALARYQAGLDPALIELPEAAVFPGLIAAQPATASKAHGHPAGQARTPRGRSIRYRLKDVLNWLADADHYGSTAEAAVATTRAFEAKGGEVQA